MQLHCQTHKQEKEGSDAVGSDSPGNFTGPRLLWLTVLLSPSELSWKPECQSPVLALPTVCTMLLSAASGGLAT